MAKSNWFSRMIGVEEEKQTPFFKETDFYKAVASYEKAQELRKKAILLGNNKKLKDAINLFEESLELDPNNLEALVNLIKAYHDIGSFMKSVETYKKAIKFHPNEEGQIRFILGGFFGTMTIYDIEVKAKIIAAKKGDSSAVKWLNDMGVKY